MSHEMMHCEEEGMSAPDAEQKYFKIAEASDLLGVKPHVLRYWESEFPQIRPYKAKNGQRLYRRRDFEALQHIQRLLYKERCTIAGARQALRQLLEKEAIVAEEPHLSPEAIEAAVEFTMPIDHSVEQMHHHDLPVDAAPQKHVKAQSFVPEQNVLEIVEERINQTQLRASLENAKAQLHEMISQLAA